MYSCNFDQKLFDKRGFFLELKNNTERCSYLTKVFENSQWSYEIWVFVSTKKTQLVKYSSCISCIKYYIHTQHY